MFNSFNLIVYLCLRYSLVLNTRRGVGVGGGGGVLIVWGDREFSEILISEVFLLNMGVGFFSKIQKSRKRKGCG